ncbi:hypothetical protein AWB78_08366 [Caballeronia calidae]|uniref:Uncharacterized protein n=1 Tax=Caballeronia calidae TaxID=1777139 RepID=A0A158EM53_9BURK|nr:hypothetical protein AWB78_08366 [Caballeronia calidae]
MYGNCGAVRLLDDQAKLILKFENRPSGSRQAWLRIQPDRSEPSHRGRSLPTFMTLPFVLSIEFAGKARSLCLGLTAPVCMAPPCARRSLEFDS